MDNKAIGMAIIVNPHLRIKKCPKDMNKNNPVRSSGLTTGHSDTTPEWVELINNLLIENAIHGRSGIAACFVNRCLFTNKIFQLN